MKTKYKITLAAFFSVIVIFGLSESTTKNGEEKIVPQETKKEAVEQKEEGGNSENRPASALNEREKNKSEEIRATTTEVAKPRTYLQNMSFFAQAPFGEWKDPRQQDGCEEASALMAVAWAKGEKIDKTQAKNKILEIAEFEKKKYGGYVDTDTEDTVERIINDFLGYEQARVVHNIVLENIKQEIIKGNVVLVPCNGRKLGNPNYTPPGPERHMLLIKGYDGVKEEFITNDAGTRQGENYRYKEDVVYEAIIDYPTGNHVPIEKETKSMIVVWK